MDIIILDNDQPATCPKCGTRTEFCDTMDGDIEKADQYHTCLGCGHEFLGKFEEEDKEEMQFFKNKEQAIDYILNELVATLQDDINNQKETGQPAEDYKELEDKIKDIENLGFLLRGAPAILEALKALLEPATSSKRFTLALDNAERAISNAGGRS